jgi:tetratricopeptide (TPR) repeat protein
MAKSRREQIEEMLADDPNDPFLRYGLAMEHASAGDAPSAIRCFEELLRIAPDYVPAYVQAGQLYARLGRDDEAKATYRAGIEVARKKGDEGDRHAADEMESFLIGLE